VSSQEPECGDLGGGSEAGDDRVPDVEEQ